MNSKLLILTLLGLAWSPLTRPAWAQAEHHDPKPSAGEEAESSRLAESRNRESMRVGEVDVLVAVGTSAGDNEYRERTPALLNSTGDLALVDTAELRRRTLAMYEEGATFDSPPKTRAHFTAHPGNRYERLKAASVQPNLPVEALGVMDEAGWSWVTPLLAFCLVGLFLLRCSPRLRVESLTKR